MYKRIGTLVPAVLLLFAGWAVAWPFQHQAHQGKQEGQTQAGLKEEKLGGRSGMMEKCREMMSRHREMASEMKAVDQELQALVQKMKDPDDRDQKIEFLEGLAATMVQSRVQMHEQMMSRMPQMMQHMSQHMQMSQESGQASTMPCPMMSGGHHPPSDGSKTETAKP